MRIARNGDWFYEGSRIERARMVKAFSTLLRVDDGETYLVTPQEKLRIVVDDAPFVAVLVERRYEQGLSQLVFTTNTGESVLCDANHPISVMYPVAGGDPVPYVLVRDALKALISRTTFYQLAEWVEERAGEYGVMSCGNFMPLSEPGMIHGA